MRTVKRIIKIHKIEGFKIYCLFNNGDSRVIDFLHLFNKWGIKRDDLEYILMSNINEFIKVQLKNGTLAWENITIDAMDERGNNCTLPYEIDPIVLFENSVLDETRQLELGLMIKTSRTYLKLTQEDLAKKSGTTKHYISKLENNRTGVEISTLKKIVEGGLGKRMKITIF